MYIYIYIYTYIHVYTYNNIWYNTCAECTIIPATFGSSGMWFFEDVVFDNDGYVTHIR